MKTKYQKDKILKLRSEGWSFNEIAKKMNLTKNCVYGIYLNRQVIHPKKRGRKSILQKFQKLAIKREISSLKAQGKKVNSTKLIKSCKLEASRFTLCRHLKSLSMTYKILMKRIPLKAIDKSERVKCAKQWLIENHPWHKTIFSDEK